MRLFIWGLGGRWGDCHFLESVALLQETWNTNQRFLKHIIAFKDANFVKWIQSNTPRPGPSVRDVEPMTLELRFWPRRYCLSLQNSFFGVIKQFLAKIWLLATFWLVSKEFFRQLRSVICWLILFMYLDRLFMCLFR